MNALGISLYPEKSEYTADKNYLALAKNYGFTRIFMNLLLFKVENIAPLVEKLRKTISYGNQLGFATYIDVNPYTLKALEIEPKELSFFADLGVKGIRLDMGFTGKEEAEMTQNTFGLQIEINMSNDDHYLDRIFDYHPNRHQLVGCHNFFPQAFTGLSVDYFVHCSKRFLEKNLHTAAFVTSQVGEVGPWSLHEGLCTMEAHRHLPIESQVKHLKLLNVVDDIIIGNAYASEAELRKMSEVFYADMLTLYIDPTPDVTDLEKTIIQGTPHTYRGDRSEYMIRSTMPRFTYYTTSIPDNGNISEIRRGDVVILNERYGQYKGEVQIALKDRPKDPRINKVGRICHDDLVLLDAVKPYTTFSLQFVKKV